MSLLILPDEVLKLVISYYIPHDAEPRGYGYCPVKPRLKQMFGGLANLSSTCSSLRKLLGEYIFSFISLVRRSELDAIMAYPRRMDGWSSSEEYRQQFLMLGTRSGELLHTSKDSISGNGLASFVTRLEISNSSLVHDDLCLFPHLNHLSVLAEPLNSHQEVILPNSISLVSLAINVETLVSSKKLMNIASKCHRLDLLCDFNFCDPDSCFRALRCSFTANNFKEINLFVSDSQALRYSSVMGFLWDLLRGTVESLSLRLYKKTSERTGPQISQVIESPTESGNQLISIISSSQYLKNLTIDLEICSRLHFNIGTRVPNRQVYRGPEPVGFTLVDYALNVPKLLQDPREVVANLVQALGASTLTFVYGEVIDQAHLHALSVVRDLVSYLDSVVQRYSRFSDISMVFLEKAWSTADDSSIRRHFEGIIDKVEKMKSVPESHSEASQQVLGVCSTKRPSFTSSRYRQREAFKVGFDYDGEGTWPMIEWGSQHGRAAFWSVETSLRDLEHYSARERVLSSLWA